MKFGILYLEIMQINHSKPVHVVDIYVTRNAKYCFTNYDLYSAELGNRLVRLSGQSVQTDYHLVNCKSPIVGGPQMQPRGTRRLLGGPQMQLGGSGGW